MKRPRAAEPRPALVAALLLAASGGGCFTSYETRGAPVPYGDNCADVLRVGKTSQGDVLKLFGAPTDIRATRDGEAYRYLYVRKIADGVNIGFSMLWGLLDLSLFRTESGREDTDNLTLFFDPDGLLRSWSYSPAFGSEP